MINFLIVLIYFAFIIIIYKVCWNSIEKNWFLDFFVISVLFLGIIMEFFYKTMLKNSFSLFGAIMFAFIISTPIIISIVNTTFLLKKIEKVWFINFTIIYAAIELSLILNFFYSTPMYKVYEYKISFLELANPLAYMQINYLIYFILGIISLFILNTFEKKLNYIIKILLMSSIYLLNILVVFLSVQIIPSLDFLEVSNMIYLVPYNCIMVTIFVFRKVTFANKTKNWSLIAIVLLILFFIVNINVYGLFITNNNTNIYNWCSVKEIRITPSRHN